MTLDTFERNFRITERNLQAGDASALNVIFGRNNVASSERSLSNSQLAKDEAARTLEVLLGRYPDATIKESASLPYLPPTVPAGLPSELLMRRPDLVSAAARLRSSAARADASRKSLLPSIRLTGGGSTSSNDLAQLIADPRSIAWNVASSLAQTVYRGGAPTAQARQALAQNEADIEAFAATALRAFREVESALARERNLAQQEATTLLEMETANKAQNLADRGFQEQLVTPLELLEARRRVISARNAMISLANQRLQNRIDLHLALGGDFKTPPTDFADRRNPSFMSESCDQQTATAPPASMLSKLGRVAVPLGVLIAGALAYVLLAEEPEEKKRPPAPPRVIKTTVSEIPLQDYQIVIETRGIVRPHDEVTLTAEVSGKVRAISQGFEDGAFFEKDEVLLELDDADYKTALLAAEAQLARSKATFAQEQARAKQARLNWDDLGYDEEPNELVLRMPQLREAEATVKSATAQLERAQRDLDRTKVRAPFDGRVRMRAVGIGQSVGTGTDLGTIFASDYAEVRLPISARELEQVRLPEDTSDPAVPVTLKDSLTPESAFEWEAEIVRTEGTLDAESLELFAIARIEDPFGRSSDRRPIRIGQPVTGRVAGRTLEQVYVIPRDAVRQLDRIFLVKKQEMVLDRQVIEPVWSDQGNFVVRDPGLFKDAFLATSRLRYTPDDAKVEILTPTEAVAEESESSASGEKKT